MSDWINANYPIASDTSNGVPDNHIITIRERRISIDFPTLIQNNVKTDTVTLDLDSEWDEISPVIIFTSKGRSVSVMYTGDPAFIPAEVMDTVGGVDLSVMGYDSTGTVRLVTIDAPSTFNVVKSGLFTGESSQEVTPDLLGQVVSIANDAANAAKSANAAVTTMENLIDSFSGNILHRTIGPEAVLNVEDAYSARPIKMEIRKSAVAASTVASKSNMIQSFGGSMNGITATGNPDGTLTLAGTPTENTMFQIGIVNPLESGKKYTISIDTPIASEYVSGVSGACLYVNVPASDGGYGTDHIFGFGDALSTTFAVPDKVTLVTLRMSCIAQTDLNGTYKVMLNEGETVEPWLPPGTRPTGINLVMSGSDDQSSTTTSIDLKGNELADGDILTIAADGSVQIVHSEGEPTNLDPIDVLKLPAPIAKVYATSDISTTISMDYVRDINVVIGNLGGA